LNITHTQTFVLNEFVVDEIRYKQFNEPYIKKEGTPERFVWDIFCDYLANDNQA